MFLIVWNRVLVCVSGVCVCLFKISVRRDKGKWDDLAVIKVKFMQLALRTS